jgi:D-3-phosphoglycerate dehydrogenase
MKVLLADRISAECKELLTAAGLEVSDRPGLDVAGLKEAIADADGVILRSGVRLTAEVLGSAKRLKAACRAGVGVDNIDIEEATRRGVIVMNTPSGNTISTAEQTMALMLGLSRNTGPAYLSMRKGEWERKKFVGSQLAGKTLGVIGLGRIGRAVARRAQAFEMRVVGLDPFVTAQAAGESGVELVESLEALLAASDYVTLHVPKTDETSRLIGAGEIEKMKRGARLINCARGGVVDEAAVVAAVKAGKLAGAAFDVYETEPPSDFGLFEDARILTTPHLGASTAEAQEAVSREAAEQMVDCLSGRAIRNAVNLLPVPAEDRERLRPHLELVRRLGRFAVQMEAGRIEQVEVVAYGEVVEPHMRHLESYALVGMMEGMMEEGANLVNAAVLARERGIRVRSTTAPAEGGFSSLVVVKVKGDVREQRVAGTVFGDEHFRVIRVGGFQVEIVPEGTILLVKGQDAPGLIGQVGTALGETGINIARMGFGRRKVGGEALLALNLDGGIEREQAEALKEIGHVTGVMVVDLGA